MKRIDMNLEKALQQLYLVSGFRMSLFDAEGKLLCIYPKEANPFCSLIQQEERGMACCLQYDKKALERARQTGEIWIYRCHCDLYEAVAPLYDFGVLSGYLMMGQVLDTSRTCRRSVLEKAAGYDIDSDLLARSVRKIPCRTKEQIEACISIMEMCAGYLSLSNYLRAERRDLTDNVRAYLDSHYREHLTLDQLCEEFYCSRASLTSSFRRDFGESVMEYLTRIRMETAVDLLNRTDQRIGEIASLCGYPDQNYFCRLFKRYYGMNPGEVRKGRAPGPAGKMPEGYQR